MDPIKSFVFYSKSTPFAVKLESVLQNTYNYGSLWQLSFPDSQEHLSPQICEFQQHTHFKKYLPFKRFWR